MKKLFLLAFVVLMAFIVLHRQCVFVRDPLATVYKSAVPVKTPMSDRRKSQQLQAGSATGYQDVASELKQSGVHVYINYSNDVLLEKDDEPGAYRILVQNWNRMPGTPSELKCIHLMACLTNADHASAIPVVPPGKDKVTQEVTMSDHEVSFFGPDGATIRVVLR
jgi:hypothetical protein